MFNVRKRNKSRENLLKLLFACRMMFRIWLLQRTCSSFYTRRRVNFQCAFRTHTPHAHSHTPHAFHTKCIGLHRHQYPSTHTFMRYTIPGTRTHPQKQFSFIRSFVNVPFSFSIHRIVWLIGLKWKNLWFTQRAQCIDRLKQVGKQNELLIMCVCVWWIRRKALALSALSIGAGVLYIRYFDAWEYYTR